MRLWIALRLNNLSLRTNALQYACHVVNKNRAIVAPLGIGDLFCETDDHCTAQISESFCDGGVCMCDYGYYAERHAVNVYF